MLADTMMLEALQHRRARGVPRLLDRVHPVERRMTGVVG